MKTLHFGVIIATLFAASSLTADEKDDGLAKQKEVAGELWKKMEFTKEPTLVESKNFLLYSRLPEARTKSLSGTLEKHLATLHKALKFEATESVWKGKLAVFVLPDRSDFVSFIRKSQKRSPRDGEVTFGTIAGNEPLLVIGEPDQPRQTPENLATYELAVSLLKRKMGAGEPPDWVADGLVRATAYRVANPGLKTRGFKAPVAPFSTLWSEQASPELRSSYAAYVVDYLVYGPGADLLSNFLSAIRPGENGATPSGDAIFKTLTGDWATFEVYARKWIKPAATKPTTPKKK